MNHFFNDLGINCVTEERENSIRLKANASITSTLLGGKRNTLCLIDIYASGSVYFEFVLDKLNKNSYTLQLFNQYNSNSLWYKAFISESGYLILMHSVFRLNNEMLLQYVSDVFQEMVSEDNLTDLKPLADLTE